MNNALEIFERLGTLIEPGKIRKELAALPESNHKKREDHVFKLEKWESENKQIP